MKKLIIILLSLTFLMPVVTPKAETLGGKWTNNIKIYFDFTGYNDISSAITTTMSIWNKYLNEIGANISISTVSSSSQANVTVKIKNYTGAVALTTNYPSKTASTYTGALIEVNSNQFNSLDRLGQLYMASHELGHVLGLDHTNTTRESVMKSSIQIGVSLPTSFDRDELDKIY